MRLNKLTEVEKEVIENRQTEPPFTGEYDDFFEPGTYVCRRCNAALFSSSSKFEAGSGWASFEENFPNSLKRVINGSDTKFEIRCANCVAHLGHVFINEHLTSRNTRHCVNSLAIRFVSEGMELPGFKR